MIMVSWRGRSFRRKQYKKRRSMKWKEESEKKMPYQGKG